MVTRFTNAGKLRKGARRLGPRARLELLAVEARYLFGCNVLQSFLTRCMLPKCRRKPGFGVFSPGFKGCARLGIGLQFALQERGRENHG